MKTNDTDTVSMPGANDTYATRWTLIDLARGAGSEQEARRALDLVMQRYRPMILGFIRKNGVNPNDWEDLCHDYLYQSFQEKVLKGADRTKGRFRTFIFHTLRAFICSDWRKQYAEKRGGGRVVSLEVAFPAGQQGEDVGLSQQELQFEIDWALSMHADILGLLRGHYAKRGEGAVFDGLVPHLLETTPGQYETLSVELGRDPAAVRKCLSRLRERYVEMMMERVHHESCASNEDPRAEAKELLKLVLVGKSRQLAAADCQDKSAEGS